MYTLYQDEFLQSPQQNQQNFLSTFWLNECDIHELRMHAGSDTGMVRGKTRSKSKVHAGPNPTPYKLINGQDILLSHLGLKLRTREFTDQIWHLE